MKARVTIGITLILLGGFVPSMAQMTAYANIYAEVVAPVGIEKTNDLTFSDINPAQNNGAILISENTLFSAKSEMIQSGTGTLASFSIANNNQTFDITLPKENFSIGNSSSNTMMISDFTSSINQSNGVLESRKTISVGASLHIPENQAPGNYSAQNTFPVTLNYN